MGIIQFKEANCKHCYKCLRVCPIKSIAVKDEQAKIIESECVLCGQCFQACPQNAKIVKSDLSAIKNFIQLGKKVYVSLAPSYAVAFNGISFSTMSKNLKNLGFFGVEETAIGAAKVTKEYEKLLVSGKLDNLITTCCPTVNLLIEKYYPELLSQMAPVASPAVVHGRLIKKVYGEDCKVVFIGPCISKKAEAENSTAIDGVILFDELHDWMGAGDRAEDTEKTELKDTVHRFYPMPGGILKTISQTSKIGFKESTVDGMENCIQVLEELKEGAGEIKGHLIEMSACQGSCLYGPGLKDHALPPLKSRDIITQIAFKKTVGFISETEKTSIDCLYTPEDLKVEESLPNEGQLQEILFSMGKTDETMLYNCGACGYNSCREKAAAVWKGKAEIKMCLPFMWSKMESQANLVFDNSPNGIVLLDENFCIVEYNHAATNMFQLYDYSYKGLPLVLLFDSSKLEDEWEGNQNYYNEVQFVEGLQKSLDITMVGGNHSADHILFIRDISEDILQRKKIEDMRAETLETAQKVIDRQMRAAQEIASLLGETTGETKVVLRNLKKSISEER